MTYNTVARFLRQALHVALNPRNNPLTFVFGNEGGDMDSVVSAIYTALLLSPSWEQPDHIPVLNFPREDLPLRCDILTMLQEHGITAEDLLFEEQLHGTCKTFAADAPYRNKDDGTIVFGDDKIFLTDHNVLRATQNRWMKHVVGIIDHHADEKKYCDTLTSDVTRIELIGSATSLVALAWKAKHGIPTATAAASPIDGATIGYRPIPSPLLLLAPIVIDTGNFVSSKNTPVDEAAGTFIRDHIAAVIRNHPEAVDGDQKAAANSTTANPCLLGFNATAAPLLASAAKQIAQHDSVVGGQATDAFAARLATLKENIRHLTVPQTLRRDYKRFALAGGFNVGISAVLLTKKQCRKLYAEDRTAVNGNDTLPAGVESDKDDEATADAHEDDDLVEGSSPNSGGYPTDTNLWLPAIAHRMDSNDLNVYMNMFNKKGRELEVIYYTDDESKATSFEAVWAYFLSQTATTVGLVPKKRFVDGKAYEYATITTKDGRTLKQVVYRQQQKKVSRKNFTPLLVTHFGEYFAALQQQNNNNAAEGKSDL